MKDAQLIFVYNADGGIFGTLTDFAHKILSPSTYSCNLCALTHGDFTMKQEWKSFIESLPVETIFFHRDEFQKRYKMQVALPAAFLYKNKAISEIISKHEIESCKSLAALKTLVRQKIEEHVQHHHPNI